MSTNNNVMWETLPNNADWDCFKTPILQEILRIQNLHQVEHCAFLEVIQLVQSVGCVRNKFQCRTAQQKSEIISLDARLRLDGIPALDFWDLIVAVLHGNTYQSNEARRDLYTNLVREKRHKLPTRKKSHGMIDDLDNVDFISSHVHFFSSDNEAVIKIIIKGRSHTMRHVSRFHSSAISVPSRILEAMSKRTQEDAGEERVTAKSKPMMNLVSRYHVRDPNVLASTAPGKPEENQI